MSSMWKDVRMRSWNPVKTRNFNPNWGQGDFTCIHTLNDIEGPWWKARFGSTVTVTKVKILNRGDCCGKRLDGAKIFIGENLCGTISNPEQGEWLTMKCKI